MRLCSICNSANDNAFDEGECGICGGAAQRTGGMIEKGLRLLSDEKAATYCISTKIPKDWMAAEEKAWDMRLKGAESIKNRLNRMVREGLSGEAKYSKDGDVRIVFDYHDGSVSLKRNELFIFGRYMKHVTGLSQSRWRCRKCDGKGCKECDGKGRHYISVEEKIGEPLKELARADDYVLHASGREDVDATNSAGRIFVMMLKNPRVRVIDLEAAQKVIEGSGEVSVHGLRYVHRGFVEVVTESHFDKTYTAKAEFGKEITDEDVAKIESLEGRKIAQRTPKRVAHRRADLIRHRRIKRIGVESHEGGKATMLIKAEAGTYIKELISGDEGRTEPSIAGILGTSGKCVFLDVTEIDDQFIDLF